jgi:single-strand DNA-binding protein
MWVDGQTSWYTVHAWRTLGNNVAASVHKGDAVVVHGRVRVDVWEREGQPPSVTHVVEASFVGTTSARAPAGSCGSAVRSARTPPRTARR